MFDPTEITGLFAGWLLPLAGLGVLALCWSRGVFRASYPAAGPRRRLRLGEAMTALGLLAVGLSAVPGVGSLPAAALFMVLVAAWPGAVRTLGLRWPDLVRAVGPGLGLGVGVGLMAMAANAAAGRFGKAIGDPPADLGHPMLEQLVQDPNLERLIGVLLLAVVVAPLLEEAAYRGLGQTVLGDRVNRRDRWAVVLLVAALFAVAHATVVTWHAMPGLFVLGAGFGVAYERTGSLWVPVVMHALFNAANIAIAMVMMA